VLSLLADGLIVTQPRAPLKRPLPPVTGIRMLGSTIETRRPPAVTFPPGNVDTVSMSARASHFAFVSPEQALRIVKESFIDPTFA